MRREKDEDVRYDESTQSIVDLLNVVLSFVKIFLSFRGMDAPMGTRTDHLDCLPSATYLSSFVMCPVAVAGAGIKTDSRGRNVEGLSVTTKRAQSRVRGREWEKRKRQQLRWSINSESLLGLVSFDLDLEKGLAHTLGKACNRCRLSQVHLPSTCHWAH